MKNAALLWMLAMPLAGCAATPPAHVPDGPVLGTLAPHRGTVVGETFTLTTRAVASPNVQLARAPDGFHGALRHAALDLHVEGDQIVGLLGGAPVRLRVERQGDVVVVQGLWAGRFAAFRFSGKGQVRCGAGWPSYGIEDASTADACNADSPAVAAMLAAVDDKDAAALLSVVMLTPTGEGMAPFWGKGPAPLPPQRVEPPRPPVVKAAPKPQRAARARMGNAPSG